MTYVDFSQVQQTLFNTYYLWNTIVSLITDVLLRYILQMVKTHELSAHLIQSQS